MEDVSTTELENLFSFVSPSLYLPLSLPLCIFPSLSISHSIFLSLPPSLSGLLSACRNAVRQLVRTAFE